VIIGPNRNPIQGIIAIPTFSRATELSMCLDQIILANQIFDIPILVIHQTGNEDVDKVLKSYRQHIDYYFQLDGDGFSPLENINRNRILAYIIGFNWLNSDWVLAIEEDVLISQDSINFINIVMQKYYRYPSFRGINLGSRIPKSDHNKETYSKLRFGINGQASAITRRTWNYFNYQKLMKKSASHPFDSQVEHYLKMGFMVTPNASRLKDIGWNGTHAPKDSNAIYYKELESSWVGNEKLGATGYTLQNVDHNWRNDIRIYKWFTTPWHFLSRLYRNKKHELKQIKTKNEN
jgi:hypothetical protein